MPGEDWEEENILDTCLWFHLSPGCNYFQRASYWQRRPKCVFPQNPQLSVVLHCRPVQIIVISPRKLGQNWTKFPKIEWGTSPRRLPNVPLAHTEKIVHRMCLRYILKCSFLPPLSRPKICISKDQRKTSNKGIVCKVDEGRLNDLKWTPVDNTQLLTSVFWRIVAEYASPRFPHPVYCSHCCRKKLRFWFCIVSYCHQLYLIVIPTVTKRRSVDF